mmetsp:Transcript_11940/g.37967  ORF Transcript_11940/g.37967 Transcript_11940/m.37967 type:complete len:321 (-) Transcript_11940:547-1509(-)
MFARPNSYSGTVARVRALSTGRASAAHRTRQCRLRRHRRRALLGLACPPRRLRLRLRLRRSFDVGRALLRRRDERLGVARRLRLARAEVAKPRRHLRLSRRHRRLPRLKRRHRFGRRRRRRRRLRALCCVDGGRLGSLELGDLPLELLLHHGAPPRRDRHALGGERCLSMRLHLLAELVSGLDNESLRRLALRCADPLRLRTALHLQLPARLFERCVPLLLQLALDSGGHLDEPLARLPRPSHDLCRLHTTCRLRNDVAPRCRAGRLGRSCARQRSGGRRTGFRSPPRAGRRPRERRRRAAARGEDGGGEARGGEARGER